METISDNQISSIPIYRIEPCFENNTTTSVETYVETYKIIDHFGNNWFFGSYEECKKIVESLINNKS